MPIGRLQGARAWGRIASLIATAKVNNVEPFAYLKATLEAIAAGHPKKLHRRIAAEELQAQKAEFRLGGDTAY